MHFASNGPVSKVPSLWLRKTFSHKRRTRCSWQGQALPPPRPLQTWELPFLPKGHRHSVLHPQSPPGKGPGPKPRPAGSGRSFSWKSTSFLTVLRFLSRVVIPNTIVSYRFLFFNHRFRFCIILRFSWFCVKGLPAVFFAPPGPGVPSCIPVCQTFIKMRRWTGSA